MDSFNERTKSFILKNLGQIPTLKPSKCEQAISGHSNKRTNFVYIK